MEQPKRNVVGREIRRARVAKAISQQRLAAQCAVLGYDLTRATLAKIEAGVRGISEVELFVIAHALRLPIPDLYPRQFLGTIRAGEVAPFHVRKKLRKAKAG